MSEPGAARARRSSLILPVNVPRFVEKAGGRGADAVVLDLEDSVAPAEKAAARRLQISYKALLNKLKKWRLDNRSDPRQLGLES